jgi:hypothetical protein
MYVILSICIKGIQIRILWAAPWQADLGPSIHGIIGSPSPLPDLIFTHNPEGIVRGLGALRLGSGLYECWRDYRSLYRP